MRAVVTSDVPPYAIVAGIPARVVRYRFDAEQQQAHRQALQEFLNSNSSDVANWRGPAISVNRPREVSSL
jgi:hypothetical protein